MILYIVQRSKNFEDFVEGLNEKQRGIYWNEKS